MSRRVTDVPDAPSPPLPADHVLGSGAVLFPGAFDQHGCPLIVFPVDAQDKLCSDLSKAEVVDFIKYFLRLHNKKRDKDSLVSVVADLRQASLPTARFIAETIILLELHKRTVHTVYIIQPKKKDAVKQLLKLMAPKSSSSSSSSSFKKVLLKEISELSSFIDRSQLPPCLGGYLVYCHHSWVTFIKEIDAFVQEFLSVVQRLPASISTLQALSRQPLPPTFVELQHFFTTNEAKFQQLRRALGLDELLQHCESIVEKLRHPENVPSYQAMAGTALFTHTAFDMLQNHSRITAAVEKVDLLWQQAFSKARLQLQVFQLREDALQIAGQMEMLLQEKLQLYKVEVAKDAAKARMLLSDFEATIHTPAMALVRCAEDVIHTLLETLPPGDVRTREPWVVDLERLKEQLHSAVLYVLQTLGAVCSYHRYYNQAHRWYGLILCENFLQELLSGVDADAAGRAHRHSNWGTIPAWRRKLASFLKKNPPPDMEELVHLAHLSNVIPDGQVQQAGKQLSHRCMTLRKLLISSGPVAVGHLKLALQWQYEFLLDGHVTRPSARSAAAEDDSKRGAPASEPLEKEDRCVPASDSSRAACQLEGSPTSDAPECKPPSLSSFDSGFDGAGGSQLEVGTGREGWDGVSRSTRGRLVANQPRIHEETLSSLSSGSEDQRDEFDFGSLGNSSRPSIQIIPQVTVDSLNFEIKVKRSAAPPSNPWLSLPVEDLENSYTVTITQNPPASPDGPPVSRSRDQPTQTETVSRGTANWASPSESSFEERQLSPIRNVLSSTITDGREKSSCTTDGVPTLLWDSYDLHDQNQDADVGAMDDSLKDWDVKEQEGLKEVEEILGRADGILEEEENILAQEAQLDALLSSESERNPWALWDGSAQHSVMSSSELAEAGVLGLDDGELFPDSESLDQLPTSTASSEMEPPADNHHSCDAMGTTPAALGSRPDLLTELRHVQALDEMIMEENLKLNQLRRECEDLAGRFASDARRSPSGGGKEREAFRLELEKERKEVAKLERSLSKELHREHRVKKHRSRTVKVSDVLAMEQLRAEDMQDQQAALAELLSISRIQSQKAEQSASVRDCEQKSTKADVDADAMETTATPPGLQIPDDPVSDLDLKEPDCSITEPVGPLISSLHSNCDMTQKCERFEEEDLALGSATFKPEASLTPATRPEDGAFDPGGKTQLPPVPKPRKSLLRVSVETAEQESHHPTELGSSTPTSDTEGPPELQPGRTSISDTEGSPEPQPGSTAASDSEGPPEPHCGLTPTSDTEGPPEPHPSRTPISDGEDQPEPQPGCSPTSDTEGPPEPQTGHTPTSDTEGLPEPQTGHTPTSDTEGPSELHPSRTQTSDTEGPPELHPGPSEDTPQDISQEDADGSLLVGQDPSEHLNNNNNNNRLCATGVAGKDEISVEDHRPLAPSRSPDLSDLLKICDPGGNEQNGSVPEVSQTSRFTGIQDQLSIRDISDFKTPVVLDTGSGLMKAGFADEDLPTIIFPTIIGAPKYEEVINGNMEREAYIGHEAQHMRGVLMLRHPIKNGIVTNWDEMEKIWHHTFQQLSVQPVDHPVLLTEAAMNPLHNRQRMVEIMFECFGVPLVYVAMQAVLALYGTGRSTGVVFDSGDGVSHSVPVFDGYCLPHAVQRFPMAGADVTAHLIKLLQEQGVSMRTSAEAEIAREMKERCCFVANDYEAELARGAALGGESYYTMPDGQVVSLGTERFRAPEILFKPELIGRDHYGMHESVFKSILGSDIDLRRNFLGNIILSGGNTLLPGLPERLEAEIKGMVPSDTSKCVRVSSPKDRDFLVWRGGAVLATMPSFGSRCISQEEYDEFGPQIVFRKCF